MPEPAEDDQRPLRYAPRAPTVALPRNGLPEPRAYPYRGTGDDVMAGQYDDPLLDAPYDF